MDESKISIDSEELKRVAVHESGHALLAIIHGIFCHGLFFAYEPGESFAGHEGRFCTLFHNSPPWSEGDYLHSAAGAGAETSYFGDYDRLASRDDRQIFRTPGAPDWEATVDKAKEVLSTYADAFNRLVHAFIEAAQGSTSGWADKGMDGVDTRFKEVLSGQEILKVANISPVPTERFGERELIAGKKKCDDQMISGPLEDNYCGLIYLSGRDKRG
jgi:hypothetical protein